MKWDWEREERENIRKFGYKTVRFAADRIKRNGMSIDVLLRHIIRISAFKDVSRKLILCTTEVIQANRSSIGAATRKTHRLGFA